MKEGSNGNMDHEDHEEDLSSDINTLRMALGYSQSGQNNEEDVDYVYNFNAGIYLIHT
jgi:hypothetical protein